MNKLLAAAAVVVALSAGTFTTVLPADAAPTYGFSVSSNQVNPFQAEDR